MKRLASAARSAVHLADFMEFHKPFSVMHRFLVVLFILFLSKSDHMPIWATNRADSVKSRSVVPKASPVMIGSAAMVRSDAEVLDFKK